MYYCHQQIGNQRTIDLNFDGVLIVPKEIFHLAENITIQTKIDLFSNDLNKPQNVDVSWEALLLMKATEFITLSLTTQLIYDDDIMIVDKDGKKGPRTQFKEVLGVGLSYMF